MAMAQVNLVTLEALVITLMQLLSSTTVHQQQQQRLLPVGLTDCLSAL